MITLGYAKQQLASVVDSGRAVNDPRVVTVINKAQERLHPKAPWDGMLCRLRFVTTGGVITLPREVESISKVAIDSYPANVMSRWYEFLGYGPGSLEDYSLGYRDLIDLGDGFACHTDLTQPMYLLVTAEREETGQSILIRGRDGAGREVRVGGEYGERLVLDHVNPRYSTTLFTTIESVVKGDTAGYVYVSGWLPVGPISQALATYHPRDTSPSFRRYLVTTATTTSPSTVVALCRMRFIPAVVDSDVLAIQSIAALEDMIQSMKLYQAKEFNDALKYETKAVQALQEQLASKEPPQNELDVQDDFAAGEVTGVM